MDRSELDRESLSGNKYRRWRSVEVCQIHTRRGVCVYMYYVFDNKIAICATAVMKGEWKKYES